MTSPLKSVFAPHLNHNIKFGRKAPRVRGLRLAFKDYVRGSLPAPPTTTNFRATADKALRQMYLNDQLGDCVIAGRYHRIGLLTGAATGKPFVATQAQVIADYSAIGGYVPGDSSTDQGCDMETAANYGVQHGYADGSKDLGWLSIDATNKTEVAQAMFLFENLDFGVGLPDAWISPFPSSDGFVWDVAGAMDPNNGHCFPGVDIATNGIVIDTWALEGVITWAAIAKYAADHNGGELYVHLNPDQISNAQAKAPNGVAWTDLIADFDALGGHVPAPAPSPVPAPPSPTPVPPPPAPSGAITLAEAEAYLATAFKHAHTVLSRAQALKVAQDALTKNWR